MSEEQLGDILADGLQLARKCSIAQVVVSMLESLGSLEVNHLLSGYELTLMQHEAVNWAMIAHQESITSLRVK